MTRRQGDDEPLFEHGLETDPGRPQRQPPQARPDPALVERVYLLGAGQFRELQLDPAEPLAEEP